MGILKKVKALIFTAVLLVGFASVAGSASAAVQPKCLKPCLETT